MKITPEIIDLICQLEFLVGKETVNKKSCGSYKYPLTTKVYRLWDVVLDKDGWSHDFTFPIEYSNGDFDFGSDEEFIQTMRYVFGVNRLHIGKALVSVLSYLEDRYSLDFAELEAQRTEGITD